MGRLIIFTGAGVSADSGLATFRGDKSSVWANHDLAEVCNIETWRANIDKVHAFYNARRAEIREAQPNAFHEAVARWSRDHEVVNITQNIDDLFERAGCQDVIHLHGFCRDLVCSWCEHKWETDGDWIVGDKCPNCSGSEVKPGVVFFGEPAPLYFDLDITMASVQHGDIVIVAGTSEKVVPITDMLRQIGCNIKVDPEASRYNTPYIYEHIIAKTAIDAVADIDAIIAGA